VKMKYDSMVLESEKKLKMKTNIESVCEVYNAIDMIRSEIEWNISPKESEKASALDSILSEALRQIGEQFEDEL